VDAPVEPGKVSQQEVKIEMWSRKSRGHMLLSASMQSQPRRRDWIPVSLALLLAAAALVAAPQSDGWISLFDGKTLNGWRVFGRPADVARNYWSVQDGLITCDSRGRKQHDHVWLLADGEYADFDMKVKVRSFRESTGNSGVQVRSRYDEQTYKLDGPQVDVHPPEPFRVGLIYDETRGVGHWLFPFLPSWPIRADQGPKTWKWKHSDEGDGWNDILIECRGTRIRSTVNGSLIADYDGTGVLDDDAHKRLNVGLRGHVGLQLHVTDDLYIQYKDVYIKPAAN